jgi:hypothetical protein
MGLLPSSSPVKDGCQGLSNGKYEHRTSNEAAIVWKGPILRAEDQCGYECIEQEGNGRP